MKKWGILEWTIVKKIREARRKFWEHGAQEKLIRKVDQIFYYICEHFIKFF